MCRLAAFIGDLTAAGPDLQAFRQLATHNPDGFGIGGYVGGEARIVKSSRSALEDPNYSLQSFSTAPSAIVHLRMATVGGVDLRNTHPFDMGQIVAHNGTVGDVSRFDELLGPSELRRLGVSGETDSERLAAYLALCAERSGGDTVEGYRLLATELAERQPMTSLTSVTTTRNGDIFALRYPENRSLFWKRVGAREAEAGHRLLQPGSGGVTVLASRPLDRGAGWTELQPGEVLHVRAGSLAETVTKVADQEPRFRLKDGWEDEGGVWSGPRRSQIIDADLPA